MIFSKIKYVPSVRMWPGEANAYRMLSDADKDKIVPLIGIKKWCSSNSLSSSFEVIAGMLGERPYIGDLVVPSEIKKPADKEVQELAKEEGGYRNWVRAVQDHPNLIPVLQRTGQIRSNLAKQAEALTENKGGLAIRLTRRSGWRVGDLAALKGTRAATASNLIIADAGQLPARPDINQCALEIVRALENSVQEAGFENITLLVTGSSFPGDFKSINETHARIEIWERQLFRVVASSAVITRLHSAVVYGDYGSAFGGKRGGGGQGAAPRIDYPLPAQWLFHRREVDPENVDLGTAEDCYAVAAKAVVDEKVWDPNLPAWGAGRIAQASKGYLGELTNPQRWTEVRVNIHLHRQANYLPPPEPPPPEEPWTD